MNGRTRHMSADPRQSATSAAPKGTASPTRAYRHPRRRYARKHAALCQCPRASSAPCCQTVRDAAATCAPDRLCRASASGAAFARRRTDAASNPAFPAEFPAFSGHLAPGSAPICPRASAALGCFPPHTSAPSRRTQTGSACPPFPTAAGSQAALLRPSALPAATRADSDSASNPPARPPSADPQRTAPPPDIPPLRSVRMSPARRLRARSSASPAARRSQSAGGRASCTFCRRAPAYPTQRRTPPSAHLSPAISSPLSSRQNHIRYVPGDSRTSRRVLSAYRTGCSRCAPGSCGSASRLPRGCCPRQCPAPHIRRGFHPRRAGTRPAPPSPASTKRAPCRG